MSHPAAPYNAAKPSTWPGCYHPDNCPLGGCADCGGQPAQLATATASPAARKPYTLPPAEAQAIWSEDRLQQECLLWLQHHHPGASRLIYHIPNGGKRTQREAAKFQAIGVKAGVPDLCLPMCSDNGVWQWHALYIELKRGSSGTVSPAQRAYHALLEAQGNKVAVVRSLPEFIALLTEYLA